MRLEVRELNKKTFTIQVNLSDTVLHLKEKIKLKKSPTPCDVDDQKLIYSGNILADDATVKECEFNKEDYITLICNPLKNVKAVEAISESNIEDSGQLSEDISNYTKASADGNNESPIKKEQNQSEVAEMGVHSSDSEPDEFSCSDVLQSIPDFENLCSIIRNDPVKLPKVLSTHGPLVFEKILQNQHAFMDLLDAKNSCNLLKEQDINDHETGFESHSDIKNESIDRLVEKGYERNLAQQAYQACDSSESSAEELLFALKN